MKTKQSKNQAWEERYRPKELRQVILPSRIKNLLDGYMAAETAPNVAFHSRTPGAGKTSTALAYANSLGAELLFIKASEENRKDTVSGDINGFCQTMTLEGKPKILILDEADAPNSGAFHSALKNAIESGSFTARFFITCNSIEALPAPLKSRCKPISFDYTEEDIAEVKPQILKRLEVIAKKEVGDLGEVSMETLEQIMNKNFPDIRAMMSDMQFCFMSNNGSIVGNYVSDTYSMIPELVECLKNGKMISARKLYIEKGGDPVRFHLDFANWCLDNLPEKYHAAIAVQVGESLRWHTMGVNDEVNVAGVLFGKMIEILRG